MKRLGPFRGVTQPDPIQGNKRLRDCRWEPCAALTVPGFRWGQVWEWTASRFEPYPGFTPHPYQDYSQPWFGTHKVLRGGCWATRSRLLRNTWRNFYTPDRRDVWAGFRTCAV